MNLALTWHSSNDGGPGHLMPVQMSHVCGVQFHKFAIQIHLLFDKDWLSYHIYKLIYLLNGLFN